MKRLAMAALFVLGTFTATLPADVVTGKIKSVDAAKNTITVTINGADQTLPVAPNTQVYMIQGRGNQAKLQVVPEGLRGLKEGLEVNLTRNEDNVVTAVQFGSYTNPAAQKAKLKNKKNP
jgi:hypothetical protein